MIVSRLTRIYESKVKTWIYARGRHTMILLVPAFFSLEILGIERRREEGPKVLDMRGWCNPSLFRQGEVKRIQGTHEDVEWLSGKEKRRRIRHGYILESLKEELDSWVGVRSRKVGIRRDTCLLDDFFGKCDVVRREVSARVRQEDLTDMSTETEFVGRVDAERVRIHGASLCERRLSIVCQRQLSFTKLY